VLVSPDRHGGSPDGWWRIAGEFAERGYAMLVIVGGSAAVALERMQELGAVNASGPIEPLVLEVASDADADADADADGLVIPADEAAARLDPGTDTDTGSDTPDAGRDHETIPRAGVSAPEADRTESPDPAWPEADAAASAPAQGESTEADPEDEAAEADPEDPTENGAGR